MKEPDEENVGIFANLVNDPVDSIEDSDLGLGLARRQPPERMRNYIEFHFSVVQLSMSNGMKD